MVINMLDSTSRDYFSVFLKKTGFVSRQGNPLIIVEFGEEPRVKVESRDFIASGCSLVVTNAEKVYQLEVLIFASQCSIVMERRTILSIHFTPNDRSNVLILYRTNKTDFNSTMHCSGELSAFQEYFISCEISFSSSVAIFRPNYVRLSEGSVRTYSIVSVSRNRSIVVIWIDIPSNVSESILIQLLYGCAVNEYGYHSQESSEQEVVINASPFPVALFVVTTHPEACAEDHIILLLNSTTSIPGLSANVLALQGANVSKIIRNSSSRFISCSSLIHSFLITLDHFQTEISAQIFANTIYDSYLNQNLASGVLTIRYGICYDYFEFLDCSIPQILLPQTVFYTSYRSVSFEFNVTGVIDSMNMDNVISEPSCSFHVHPVGSRYRFYATVSSNQITNITFNSGFIVAENGYINNPVVFSVVHSWEPLTVTMKSSGITPPFLVEYSFSVNVDMRSEEMVNFVEVKNGAIQTLEHHGIRGWLLVNPMSCGTWSVTMMKGEW